MLTGLAVVDNDHREIFECIKGTTATTAAQRSTMLRALFEAFSGHFRREEQYMEQVGFPQREWHALHHRRFLERLRKAIESGGAQPAEVPLEALDVLFHDALNGDVELAAWVANRPRA